MWPFKWMLLSSTFMWYCLVLTILPTEIQDFLSILYLAVLLGEKGLIVVLNWWPFKSFTNRLLFASCFLCTLTLFTVTVAYRMPCTSNWMSSQWMHQCYSVIGWPAMGWYMSLTRSCGMLETIKKQAQWVKNIQTQCDIVELLKYSFIHALQGRGSRMFW